MANEMSFAQGKFGRVIALRLKPGTDVLPGLTEACVKNNIQNGVIVSGIGSLDGAKFCNPIPIPTAVAGYGYGKPTELTGAIELTGMSGVICNSDGEINLHVHVNLSDRNGSAFGGHLVEGTPVLLTCDCVIAELEGLILDRKYDESLGVPICTPKQL